MSLNFKEKKVGKKQRRCEEIITNEYNIKSSRIPTQFIGILNAGLSTGLTEESVLHDAKAHGQVTQLLMIPNKSYCFLKCASSKDAENIYKAMNNIAQIGQKGSIVYLSYFEDLPKIFGNVWEGEPPPGLIVLKDFVSHKEELELLNAVSRDNKITDNNDELKHRRVKHFGFEFLYGVNNVNPDKPLDRKIPPECDIIWTRLKKTMEKNNMSLEWDKADQLTVNEYEPGQGIPPHVDTHSAFLEPILSLSLEDDVVMEFRKGSERVYVILPRLSLLVMTGESRYEWTHGITPRRYDIIPTSSGFLTTKKRSKRTSLTFRRLRRAPCDCKYPFMCDTRLQNKTKNSEMVIQNLATQLEEVNVHNVYDQIANHFSETRHTPWPKVTAFLESFPIGSIVLDIGCGNGKYLKCNSQSLTMGCDRSLGLLNVCINNNNNVFRCDCLAVPFSDQIVDGCFSIAVIHHLATSERRLQALQEMARILKQGGRALIYVWAKEQQLDSKKSSYLRQNKAVNKQRITENEQRELQRQELHQKQNEAVINLPIHTNRTDFEQQDVLVPWKLKEKHQKVEPHKKENNSDSPSTFLRYYHVFEKGELDNLVMQIPEVEVIDSYYDQGNHCIIFRKL